MTPQVWRAFKAHPFGAALQLVDSGDLGLDEDINRYLRQLTVPAQGYPPITLAHLLSHTSGLDEIPGRQFDPDKGPRPSLGEFLKNRLVRYRAPGLYTAYSSYGIALAGVAIEDASGLPYDEFVRRRILEPCGMTSARIMQRRGDEQGVATPYAIEDGHAAPIPHEWYVTTPTSSLVATVADMARSEVARYLRALSRTCCAARTPLANAPPTVAASPFVSQASPEKNKVSSTGLASVPRALPPCAVT